MDIGSVLFAVVKVAFEKEALWWVHGLVRRCGNGTSGSSIDEIFCYIIQIILGFKKKGKIVISE